MNITWISIGKSDLEIERRQLEDEGKDISSVAPEFDALLEASDELDDVDFQNRARHLMDSAAGLPVRQDYAYEEPSDIEAIRALRPSGDRDIPVSLDPSDILDKIHGALLGRCCGCLLGKPVENWHSPKMWGYLKDLDRFPLDDYFTSAIPEDLLRKYEIKDPVEFGYLPDNYFIDRVSCMREDDDTNYTVAAMLILQRWGKGFTASNVGEFWLENFPLIRTCTAERIVYKNLLMLKDPPEAAISRNPYREGIGAQIRADAYGYVSPGRMARAAEWAWRDGRLSHVKNGLYGAMWVGAMLAGAYVTDNPAEIIAYGLEEIPESCRLGEAIRDVLAWRAEDIDYREAVLRIHRRWDENAAYSWGHAITNAQIVAMAMLWGELDFERSICHAVETCFDTDCNGATVGSVVGLCLGARNLPEKWTSPLNDRLETCIPGYQAVSLSQLARDFFTLYQRLI